MTITDNRSKTSKINGTMGGRPRAPRVTLTFCNFFIGQGKGSHQKTVALTAKAIISETCRHMGSGWGCRVQMTREQIAAVGGWETATGFALDHGFYFVDVI